MGPPPARAASSSWEVRGEEAKKQPARGATQEGTLGHWSSYPRLDGLDREHTDAGLDNFRYRTI